MDQAAVVKRALAALRAAQESLTLVVAEGCDKCDPEGIAYALGLVAAALRPTVEPAGMAVCADCFRDHQNYCGHLKALCQIANYDRDCHPFNSGDRVGDIARAALAAVE